MGGQGGSLTRDAGILLVFASISLLAGCAGVQRRSTGDPLEPVNRATYAFNDALDRFVLGPVSEAYVKVTPQPVRTGIYHFFDNLDGVNVIVNDLLQGEAADALSDFWRVVFNATLGLLGVFDIATPMGLERHRRDFGQTLGVWGLGEGAYLVLPVVGPSSLRDAPGLAVAAVASPLFYVQEPALEASAVALDLVDTRARVDSALQVRKAAAVDPYLFTREAYRQYRLYLISGGRPLRPTLEEEPEDEDDAGPEEPAPHRP